MEEVITYLQVLPEEKWATKVNSTWDVKDVAAHLIAWNYEAAREIERVSVEGGKPWFLGAENVDDFNALAVENYGKMSKEEIILELKASDGKMDRVIGEIGEEKLKKQPGLSWLFDKGTRKPHSIQHLDQIKEAVGNGRKIF